MKPSKEAVHNMVATTKAAAAEYHALNAEIQKLDAVPAQLSLKLEKAGYKASELNKQLRAMLVLFTEEERNEMRKEFEKVVAQ